MAERSLFFRISVKGGKKVERDLHKVATSGSKEFKRLEKATVGASGALRAVDKAAVGSRRTFDKLGTSIALVPGPLGGMASQFTALSSSIGRFGVVGAGAALVLGGIVTGFVSATSTAAEFEKRLGKIEALNKATAQAAGLTVNEIEKIADRIGRATLASQEDVLDAAAALQIYRKVGREVFEEVIGLAQDMSATIGGDLLGNIRKLGRALDDPVQGLEGLTRFISFGAKERELIKNLSETGRQAEALRIILDKLQASMGGAGAGEAKGLRGAQDSLSQSWSDLKREFGNTEWATAATQALNLMVNDVQRLTKVAKFPFTFFGGGDADAQAVEAAAQVEARANQEIAAAGRRALALEEIEVGLDKRLRKLTQSNTDRIIADRDRILQHIKNISEGLSAEDVRRVEALAGKVSRVQIGKLPKAKTPAAAKADPTDRLIRQQLFELSLIW